MFKGLFPPEHDQEIQTLLFQLAQWHALVKLRLHTDHSLKLLDEACRLLGGQLRKFQDFTSRLWSCHQRLQHDGDKRNAALAQRHLDLP